MARNILQRRHWVVTREESVPDNLLFAAQNVSWTPDVWTPGLPSVDEWDDTYAPVLFQNMPGRNVIYIEPQGQGVKVMSVSVKAPGKC